MVIGLAVIGDAVPPKVRALCRKAKSNLVGICGLCFFAISFCFFVFIRGGSNWHVVED